MKRNRELDKLCGIKLLPLCATMATVCACVQTAFDKENPWCKGTCIEHLYTYRCARVIHTDIRAHIGTYVCRKYT